MAASLDDIEVTVSSTKIAPGEEVTVTTSFGTELGAYTIDVAYDDNIFEYVSSEGGTENDNGTRVRLTYYDSTGGTNPREAATVTFKAKADLLTSNPTDFAVTLEGLSNADASETYDDISVPIKKDVLVEPNYVDYALTLEYEGTIEPNVEKEMTLTTSSSMGKNYDHVRLIAEVVAEPSDSATAKLLAINEDGVEIDLIQNGWGDASGYEIGGKNVNQELQLKGQFDEIGNYGIHIKLIDRDDSDAVIVEKTFNLAVAEKQIIDNDDNTTTPDQSGTDNEENDKVVDENLPEVLPKTGRTQYAIIITTIVVLAVVYSLITRRNREF